MIKNESELASMLGNAFASYANKVQNGLTQPYRAFLDGVASVDVTVTLQGDVITVKVVEKPVIEPFVSDDFTVKSPFLEATEDESDANVPELSAIKEIIEKPEPKRKRKKSN